MQHLPLPEMVRGIEDRLKERKESQDTLSFHYFLLQEMLLAGYALVGVALLLCRAEMHACGAPFRLWPEVTGTEAWGNSLLPLFTCPPIVCLADTAPLPESTCS